MALVNVYRTQFRVKMKKMLGPQNWWGGGCSLFKKHWIGHMVVLSLCILHSMNKHLKSYARTTFILSRG
jgi:hypothetical protein